MNKRCLITGVAGFIGSSIADRLLELGCEVVGIDTFLDYYPREIKERNIEQARSHDKFTLLDQNLLEADLTQICADTQWVFHQAGQAGVRASWGSYFDTYTANNINATQRLLEAVKGSSALEKFVYASSSSVYGNALSMPTSESVLPQPISPYGVTKLAAEHLVNLYASQYNVPSVSLRYFTVYGPRQRPDMAFNRFIKAALQEEQLTLYGDGEQTRDFTYISDAVEANLLAAQHGKQAGVYNIGGGSTVSINQVLAMIEEKIGSLKVGKTLNIAREEKQRGDARHTSSDTTKSKQELQFQPKVSLSEGISNEIEWMNSCLK